MVQTLDRTNSFSKVSNDLIKSVSKNLQNQDVFRDDQTGTLEKIGFILTNLPDSVTIYNRYYLLKVSNRKTRTKCQVCSKLTIKIPERRQWR